MLYLYAIVDRPEHPLSTPDGLAERPPLLLGERGVAMVASEIGKQDVTVSEENLRRHEAVVEALMTERAVLPMRFGCRLPDAGSVSRLLSCRHDELARELERLRGCVEIGLRVWLTASLASPPTTRPCAEPGTAYIEALRLRRHGGRCTPAQAASIEAVHSHLADAALAEMREPDPPPGQALVAAYLVHDEDCKALLRETWAQSERHPEFRLLCTGPWPPYSFVALELGFPVEEGVCDGRG